MNADWIIYVYIYLYHLSASNKRLSHYQWELRLWCWRRHWDFPKQNCSRGKKKKNPPYFLLLLFRLCICFQVSFIDSISYMCLCFQGRSALGSIPSKVSCPLLHSRFPLYMFTYIFIILVSFLPLEGLQKVMLILPSFYSCGLLTSQCFMRWIIVLGDQLLPLHRGAKWKVGGKYGSSRNFRSLLVLHHFQGDIGWQMISKFSRQ